MSASLVRKGVRAEFKARKTPGEFDALFSVFGNVDRDGDRIVQGAFAPALAANPTPAVVWTHRWDIPPIGETLEAEETEKGARGVMRLFLDEHEVARQVSKGLASGALNQFSFSAMIGKAEEPQEPISGEHIQDLLEFSEIFEWGPTLVGANSETTVLASAKSFATLLGVDARAVPEVGEHDLDALILSLKSGARNSQKDGERLQTIHDLAVLNGATCEVQDEAHEEGGDGKSALVRDLIYAHPRHVVTP